MPGVQEDMLGDVAGEAQFHHLNLAYRRVLGFRPVRRSSSDYPQWDVRLLVGLGPSHGCSPYGSHPLPAPLSSSESPRTWHLLDDVASAVGSVSHMCKWQGFNPTYDVLHRGWPVGRL